jgi:hypothetical protein
MGERLPSPRSFRDVESLQAEVMMERDEARTDWKHSITAG